MPRHPLLAVLVVGALLLGCGGPVDGGDDTGSPTTTSTEAPAPGSEPTEPGTPPGSTEATEPGAGEGHELPRGGTEIFPAHRVVAHYGNAESEAMGVLGETGPEEAAARLQEVADRFVEPDRPVLPAFELIVTVAQPEPGPNGTYSAATPVELVWEWLEAARAADMLLILDLQPGTGDFLTDARRFEELLREPDVGLALDPEWRMPEGQVPGRTIGTVDAAEVNQVSEWLAGIVAEEGLPEKLFVLHLFTDSMITDRDAVEDRPGLATVFHVDGFGGRAEKLQKYDQLRGPYATGFKLFLRQDVDMFEPDEVLAMDRPPDLVTYQ